MYFPAVPMDHKNMGHNIEQNVSEKELNKEKFVKKGTELIHIEADIHATKGNPNGFGVGEWIPYLSISFELIDKKSNKTVLSGKFMPMVAKDGPHYGTTLRMPGVGEYKLKYKISPPAIARHSDKLTGVEDYWKEFEVAYDFEYEGLAR